MARLFTDGAEFQDDLFFTSVTPGIMSISTSPVRSGAAAYNIQAGINRRQQKSFTAVSEGYLRFAFRITQWIGTLRLVIWWSSLGGTELGSLRLNSSSGKLELYTGTGTLVDTGDLTISVDTWYLVEIRIKIADASGVLDVRIDGNADATFTGDTKPGSDTTFSCVSWGTNQNNSQTFYLDDIAFNDTSGGADDSWCGDGKVILLKPNANGDVSQLVGSDADSTDNYLHVDEIPKDDDSTYVQGGTVDERDLYNLTACGLTNVTIQRVWAEARCRETVASGSKVALVIKTSSTEYTGTDRNLLTTYGQVLGDQHTVNPATSSAWTTSELDALQVGPKTR